MTIFDAVLLGLLQALGEFLPISSSAHLVLLPFFRGAQYQGVTFDVMLHLATLLAVILYFAKDWFFIIKNGLTKPTSQDGKTLWLLALATVPAGLAGVLLQDWIETAFRNPLMIAACLMIFAVILWLADRKAQNTDRADINLKKENGMKQISKDSHSTIQMAMIRKILLCVPSATMEPIKIKL